MTNRRTELRRAAPGILLITIVVLLVVDAQQLCRLFRLDTEASNLLQQKNGLLQKQKLATESEKVFADRIIQLRKYEQAIPDADGYVWVSKVLHDATPKLFLVIDPPEINAQLLSTPEYCTGLFRVRGSGSVDELLVILKKVEEELPFARVQDLQIAFAKNGESKTDFAFSLLAVLRMNEEQDPVVTKASL